MASRSKNLPKTDRSQRQLRVGEMLRRAVVDVLTHDAIRGLDVDGRSIIVSEVRVSPDIKRATIFCTEFSGRRGAGLLEDLNGSRREIRTALAKRISLKTTPEIEFRLDTTFDDAQAVDEVLKRDRVRQDLDAATDKTDAGPEGN